MRLNPYTYYYKKIGEDYKRDSLSINVNKESHFTLRDSTIHFGLIAQDVEPIFPNLITKDEKGYMSINYVELIPVLIQAIKEQNDKIVSLESEVQKLKNK